MSRARPLKVVVESASNVADPQEAVASAQALQTARERRGQLTVLFCAALAALGVVLSIMLGPLDIGPFDVIRIGLGALGFDTTSGLSRVQIGVVENIRGPRALLGALAGAALGGAGAAMQGFFRNPLADPALIGVSAGGALAAVAVIVLGGAALAGLTAALGSFALPIAAFLGALITVFAIYTLSMMDGRVVVATMLLAGVAANALAFSGIGYLTFLADDAQLRDLTFWTLGSMGGATWERVLPAALGMAIALTMILSLARPLNSLLLGEDDANALGVDVERTKRLAAVGTALGVGAATAVCGIINFIGLVVPHLVRLVTGPDHRYVLPGSCFLGAALVLVADIVARIAVSPAELPLGVVTAAIGAPFFFWLLVRDKKRSTLG
ncbi:MAG: iron ABC transporter permease [Pseudomonadota bacterium]